MTTCMSAEVWNDACYLPQLGDVGVEVWAPVVLPLMMYPNVHWIGAWVSSRAVFAAVVKTEVICHNRGLNPSCPKRTQSLVLETIFGLINCRTQLICGG